MATVNETGTVQERYVYDAFGNVNGLNSDWNRTFTGQVLDAETGLMLYRNRFYSTELGRFLQRDPIGYEAEDENLVRYVLNSPVDLVDPSGLVTPLNNPGAYCPQPSEWEFDPETGEMHPTVPRANPLPGKIKKAGKTIKDFIVKKAPATIINYGAKTIFKVSGVGTFLEKTFKGTPLGYDDEWRPWEHQQPSSTVPQTCGPTAPNDNSPTCPRPSK